MPVVCDALPALAGLAGMRPLALAPSFAGKHMALSLPPPWQSQVGTGLVSNPLPLSLCREKDSLAPGSWDLQRGARVVGRGSWGTTHGSGPETHISGTSYGTDHVFPCCSI